MMDRDKLLSIAISSLNERGQLIVPSDIPGLYDMSGPFGSGEVTSGQVFDLFGGLARNMPIASAPREGDGR